MSKYCRVFSFNDGVAIDVPKDKFQDDVSKCPVPANLSNSAYVILELDELKELVGKSGMPMDLYFDGDVSRKNLKLRKRGNKAKKDV